VAAVAVVQTPQGTPNLRVAAAALVAVVAVVMMEALPLVAQEPQTKVMRVEQVLLLEYY
jgi:hypothetical protein